MAFLLGDCHLLDLIENKNITQADFARYMGCSRSYVNQLYKGKATMSLEFAINAAHFLNCSVNDFYTLHWSSKRK